MKKLFSFLHEIDGDDENEKIRERVVEKFGGRGKKAIKGVEERRVKKYKDFWVVVGEKEHIVVNHRFCSCEDYLYNVSSVAPEASLCWHSIATKLAEFLDLFDEISDWYLDYQKNLLD